MCVATVESPRNGREKKGSERVSIVPYSGSEEKTLKPFDTLDFEFHIGINGWKYWASKASFSFILTPPNTNETFVHL